MNDHGRKGVKATNVFLFLLLALALSAALWACGDDDDDDEDCPSFADYQVYPEVGDGDSVYELYVRLKTKSVNKKVERVYARLYASNGQPTGEVFDLVRTEADHYRYLRTFTGDEVCESGTCSLYFKVFAEHTEGCVKAFETDMFQVVIEETGDDDTQ